MRKFAILLSLVVSFTVLTGCANKSATDQNLAADQGVTAQQDYKGEMSKK